MTVTSTQTARVLQKDETRNKSVVTADKTELRKQQELNEKEKNEQKDKNEIKEINDQQVQSEEKTFGSMVIEELEQLENPILDVVKIEQQSNIPSETVEDDVGKEPLVVQREATSILRSEKGKERIPITEPIDSNSLVNSLLFADTSPYYGTLSDKHPHFDGREPTFRFCSSADCDKQSFMSSYPNALNLRERVCSDREASYGNLSLAHAPSDPESAAEDDIADETKQTTSPTADSDPKTRQVPFPVIFQATAVFLIVLYVLLTDTHLRICT